MTDILETTSGHADHGPLSGVVVVELAHMVSIPTTGRILAELGAEVIKVEPPSGDLTRHLGARGLTNSAMFHAVNRDKHLVTADIREPEGRTTVLALLETADLFLSNIDAALLASAGFDPESLRQRFPQLAIITMGGGDSGRSTDGLVQCATGLTTMTGPADDGGYRTGAPVVDVNAGVWGALAAVVAVLNRGSAAAPGATIELEDVGLFMQYTQVAMSMLTPETSRRRGNHSALACTPMVHAADGRVAMTILHDRHWRALATALERPDLIDDARFAGTKQRQANQAELELVLSDLFAAEGRDHWVRLLSAAGVPVAAERNYQEVLAVDRLRTVPMIEIRDDEPQIPVVRLPVRFERRGDGDAGLPDARLPTKNGTDTPPD